MRHDSIFYCRARERRLSSEHETKFYKRRRIDSNLTEKNVRRLYELAFDTISHLDENPDVTHVRRTFVVKSLLLSVLFEWFLFTPLTLHTTATCAYN